MADKDRAIPAGLPKAFRGQNQIDGTATNLMGPGTAGKRLQDRASAPNGPNRSGMENSMGDLADQMHKGQR